MKFEKESLIGHGTPIILQMYHHMCAIYNDLVGLYSLSHCNTLRGAPDKGRYDCRFCFDTFARQPVL